MQITICILFYVFRGLNPRLTAHGTEYVKIFDKILRLISGFTIPFL